MASIYGVQDHLVEEKHNLEFASYFSALMRNVKWWPPFIKHRLNRS